MCKLLNREPYSQSLQNILPYFITHLNTFSSMKHSILIFKTRQFCMKNEVGSITLGTYAYDISMGTGMAISGNTMVSVPKV